MKPDIYTKAVLTVIAIMLTLIVCKQYINPAATVQAQGQGAFSGVQFSAGSEQGYFWLFDSRTGDVWYYTKSGTRDHLKVSALGGSLTIVGR